MNKILVPFLSFIITAPVWAFSISGIVLDKDGAPVIGAHIVENGTNDRNGTTSDLEGKFTLQNIANPDSKLTISSIGFKSQTISQNKASTIILVEDNEILNEVAVVASVVGQNCNNTKDELALPGGKYVSVKTSDNKDTVVCKQDACLYDTYIVQRQSDGSFKCVLDTSRDRTNKSCKSEELGDANATAGVVSNWIPETDTVVCKITKCKDGYEPDLAGLSCIDNRCPCGSEWNSTLQKCEQWSDTTCSDTSTPKLPRNAQSATKKCDDNGKVFCEISACISDDYTLNDKKTECSYNGGQPCTSNDPNAASAKLEPVNGKLECLIVSCNKGWNRSDDRKTCTAIAGLSEEDYKKQMDELTANAQKMRANENSLANKTLGAAGMGATGIGGMMALSALSEQTADANAENDMRAYLETFRCEYGSGTNARGGDTNVELPGGNDMFNLYAQYATLSEDLRVRKNALGIKPGIESEIVIDKAETGLYDDVGTGITGGAYASVARALTNTTGADAQKWAEQKSKTAKNLDTGKTTAIVGAAGSLVANLAMNSNVVNNADNILNTYEQLKTTPDAIVNAANVANAGSTTPPQQNGGNNNNNDNNQSNSSSPAQPQSPSDEGNTELTDASNSAPSNGLNWQERRDIIAATTVANLQEDPKSVVDRILGTNITDAESELIKQFANAEANKDAALYDIDNKAFNLTSIKVIMFSYSKYDTPDGTFDKVDELTSLCEKLNTEICTSKSNCEIGYFTYASKGSDPIKHAGCELLLK